ncbi:calcium-binding protein [Pleionea mediterranea]|uniref:Ca2+-binding RTX toxin-like protein n=1 Tax=Pleionea mediterranea TaxID=523701 RepID=A0A316F7T1_9GAMM|nr:calcium-binding protein [Pleionea mediterranea]PWK42801.1 Ca2+-binding RTX toxin-like protein [Pleionea mediterranea]
MNIEKEFYNSLISLSSYVDFQEGEEHTEQSSKLSLNEDEYWKSSDSMIDLFLEKFEVLSHKRNASSGFSATVFKNIKSNEVVFANRGTSISDLSDIHADVDIVLNGVPRIQAISLFNYVSYLKAPFGENFLEAKLTSNGLVFNNTGVGAGKENWFSVPVDVTGHSLGGNLSGALGRLFPNMVKDLYVYNSAGTAGMLAQDYSLSYPYISWNPTESEFYNYFDQFGSVDSYENFQNVFNVYGEDGYEFVTNDIIFNQVGGKSNRVGVNTEGGTHSSIALAESLSVAWIFNKLDPSFTLADHSSMLDAAKSSEPGSLLRLTSELSQIINSKPVADLWDGVYDISKLENSTNVTVLSSKSHEELIRLYSESENKKALIYSAKKGLPFSIDGSYTAYESIDESQYSVDAAADLMGKLAVELNIHARDSSVGNELSVGNANFSFDSSQIIKNEVSMSLLSPKNIKFGGYESDSLTGTSEENRLYGLGGADTLTGSNQYDILDGGNDNDILNGNEGEDILIGGKGDDTIEGGKGKDTLWGGEGDDTYLFNSESGHDTIENIYSLSGGDEDGKIEFDGLTIDGSSAKKKSEGANVFYDEDNKITYSLIEKDLTIEFEQENEVVSSVTVRGFENGFLGINLPGENDEAEEPEDNTSVSFTVTEHWNEHNDTSMDEAISDPNKDRITIGYFVDENGYTFESDGDGNKTYITESQTIVNDTVYKTYLQGGSGHDRLTGGVKGDTLLGGRGDDYLIGKEDIDLLLGRHGSDHLDGGEGDDRLIGGVQQYIKNADWDTWPKRTPYYSVEEYNSMEDFKEDDDTLIGGAGNDEIKAGRGKDYVNGGDGEDLIYGGAHNDRIEGGSGNDVILSDGMYATEYVTEWSGDDEVIIDSEWGWNLIPYIENAKKQAGDDTVYGGTGDDYIAAGAGNDVIYGGDGNDKVFADGNYNRKEKKVEPETESQFNGNDVIYAGKGEDIVIGYGGDDTIDGGDDNDELFGDSDELADEMHGKDLIKGGAGDDRIRGYGKDDRLYGNEGKDVIGGDKGNDYIEGNEGEDELQGGEGDDRLFGNTDNDLLFGQDGNDHLDGGSGVDKLQGGKGNDILIGGLDVDYLWGEDGDDSLSGGSGDDELNGGSGNDVLAGNSGRDRIDGGAGNDTIIANIGDGESFIVDQSGSNIIQFGAGVSIATVSVEQMINGVLINYGASDIVFIENSSIGYISQVNFADGRSVSMSRLLSDLVPEPTASTSGTGHTSATINASSSDVSYSRDNNNLVLRYTGDNSDWINIEYLQNQGYVFAVETVEENGQTFQQLRFINWYNANPRLYLNSLNFDNESVDLTTIELSSSNIEGSEYTDNLTGDLSNNIISSGAGNDIIDASSGDDSITGGLGDDLLSGGEGNDTYFYNIGDGKDIISESSGNDTILFGSDITPDMLTVTERKNGLHIQIGESGSDVIFIKNWSLSADNKVENFNFKDGTQLGISDIEDLIIGNRSPVINIDISDQNVQMGEPLELDLSDSYFSDPDGDELSFRIMGLDGASLPDWIKFDVVKGVISGKPGFNDTDDFEIVVTANDPSGYYVRTQFNLNVNEEDGYIGTDGDDVIVGTQDNDYIFGMGGNDKISGLKGSDRIVGGKGDDELLPSYGNDILEFSLGDGKDRINIPANDIQQFLDTDTILFGKGISPDSVRLLRGKDEYNTLVIDYGYLGDEVIVDNFFDRGKVRNSIDRIGFYDGTVWNLDDIINNVEHIIDSEDNHFYQLKPLPVILDGLAGNDRLDGNFGDDHLIGNIGDDYLYGDGGNDIIEGGVGNDIIRGGQGDDTLIGGQGDDGMSVNHGNNIVRFSKGHGLDVIYNRSEEGQDIIHFDATINPSDISYYRFGDHMVIGSGEENYVIISNMYGHYIHSDEIRSNISIKIDDGSVTPLSSVEVSGGWFDLVRWSNLNTDVFGLYDYPHGYMGDSDLENFDNRVDTQDGESVVYGSPKRDIITTGKGNSLVRAFAGNDKISGNQGINQFYPGKGDDQVDAAGVTHLYLEYDAGADSVRRYWTGLDKLNIHLPDNVSIGSFNYSLTDNNNDLVINYGASNDSITLDNMMEISESHLSFKYDVSVIDSESNHDNNAFKEHILLNYNFAPVGTNDTGYSVTTGETLTINASEILANDHDINEDELTISGTPSSDSGTVNYDSETGIIQFTPEEGFIGNTMIEYVPFDGDKYADLSTQISVTVTAPDNSGGGDHAPPGGDNPDDYDNHVTGSDNAEQLYRGHNADYIEGLGGDDQLYGLGGNDYLSGGDGNDYLDGGEGDDIQSGGAGNDQLGGDTGNDILIGGSGDDIYVFRPGSGQDTIKNGIGEDGTDWLIFTGDITSDRLVFVRDGDNLVIQITDSTDQVTIENWFLGSEYQVDYIQPSGASGMSTTQVENMLSDGSEDDSNSGGTGSDDNSSDEGDNTSSFQIPDPSTYTYHEVGTANAEQLYRSNDADFLEALAGDDQLFGLAGNDFLHAGEGNDYLDGGDGNDIEFGAAGDDQLGGDAGNDLLVGGSGNDRYVFRPNSGQDTIDNSVGDNGTDWLLFTDNITEDRLNFSRDGDNLIISIADSSDSVTVQGWYLSDKHRIDYIQPAGGSGIPANTIESMVSSNKLSESLLKVESSVINIDAVNDIVRHDLANATSIEALDNSNIERAILNIVHEKSVSREVTSLDSIRSNEQLASNELEWLSAM